MILQVTVENFVADLRFYPLHFFILCQLIAMHLQISQESEREQITTVNLSYGQLQLKKVRQTKTA